MYGLGGGKCYPLKSCQLDVAADGAFDFTTLYLTAPLDATTNPDLTSQTDPIGYCRQYCLDTFPKEAAYFVLAHGTDCHCMAMYGVDSARGRTEVATCNMPCAGNSAVMCGAADRHMVYATEVYPHTTYLGCHKDYCCENRQLSILDENGEMYYAKDAKLQGAAVIISIDEVDNFAGMCGHVCKTRFPEVFGEGNLLTGLQNGKCYCGHKERFGRNPPTLTPNPQCWERCGDTNQKCGGSGGQNVYMVDRPASA
eukprot:GDKI01047306.1.p1 GENE.GDKI01047306.1~~GDKI01047306.1.p1  ORF type:complete len:254 (-),score=80.43 GDKI01047306.1:330-1091(-)